MPTAGMSFGDYSRMTGLEPDVMPWGPKGKGNPSRTRCAGKRVRSC